MTVNTNSDYLLDGLTNVTFKDLESGEEQIENVLNTVGYIPFVSVISATARQVYAVAQIVVGVTLGVFCAISYYMNDDASMKQKAFQWFNQVSNGIGNAIRAEVERVPFIGNLVAAVYDNAIGLRMAYPSENPDYSFLNVFHFKKV